MKKAGEHCEYSIILTDAKANAIPATPLDFLGNHHQHQRGRLQPKGYKITVDKNLFEQPEYKNRTYLKPCDCP
jgi:hypothetical protein